LHFLSKYQVTFQRTKNTIEAIQESLLFSGSAIITTFVLVLGCGIFLFSNFGLMSGLSLFLVMIFDLLLLPAILIYFNMKKREYYY